MELKSIVRAVHDLPEDNKFEPLDLDKGIHWFEDNLPESGILVWCEDTWDMWYVANQEELNNKFIYQDDLQIYHYFERHNAIDFMLSKLHIIVKGVYKKHKCYVLVNDSLETYMVYYDPKDVLKMYGVAVPKFMSVYKFKDRFERDKYILKLEEKYTYTPRSSVAFVNFDNMPSNTAIIVSDGSHRNGITAYSYFAIRNGEVIHQTKSIKPSVPRHTTLIAEVSGVYSALRNYVVVDAEIFHIYFDNKSVYSLLSNTKFNNVREFRTYRNYIQQLRDKGKTLYFHEVHPKKEKASMLTKAVTYLHNTCDKACSDLASLISQQNIVNRLLTEEGSDEDIRN